VPAIKPGLRTISRNQAAATVHSPKAGKTWRRSRCESSRNLPRKRIHISGSTGETVAQRRARG